VGKTQFESVLRRHLFIALAKSNNTTLNKLIEHLLFEALGRSNEYLISYNQSLDLPEREK
jgi:hypothetical protein